MNDEPEIELTSALGLLRWIGWAQMKAATDWTQERDLTQQQSFALGFLVEHPGSIQRDVAEITRTTPASVSSLLQGLEKRGLIERRTEGGNERSKRVYATPAGAAMIDGFDEFVRDLEQRILAPLDDGERKTLVTLLAKITAELPRPTRS
jgi:MarR family transcriptional repressor of mepA